MKQTLLLLLLLPTLACSTSITEISAPIDQVEDSSVTSKITIDLNKTFQTIDKQFYGSHIDSYSELPGKELVDELQLGKIRIGGNDFDVYNWKIGKTVTSRGEIRNAPSFENLASDMALYKVNGIFQVNLSGFQPEKIGNTYTIKRSFTAESAYEMIKYLNGKLKLNITDFSLGNEFSIWNETHPKLFPSEEGISADEYIERYIQYAVAIRRAQDEVNGNPNSIKLWGPEMTSSWYDWNTGNFTKDCQWGDIKGQVNCSYGGGKFTNFIPYFFSRIKAAESDKTVNPKNYKLMDYFSIHYYPNFRTKNSDPDSIIKDESGMQMVAEMLESTRVWNDPTFINKYDKTAYRNVAPNILSNIKKWMKEYYPDALLAMNEFSVDSDYRSNGYHPIVRPLYLADSIGIFTKEGISYLNQFILSSPSHSPLPWSLIEGGSRQDLFYMYKLFTNHFKGTVVEVSDNLGDEVNAYATKEGTMINLAVINKSPVSKKVQIYLKEAASKKMITYTAPGWSSSIIKFDKNAESSTKAYKVFNFGAKEMSVSLDTAYEKKASK